MEKTRDGFIPVFNLLGYESDQEPSALLEMFDTKQSQEVPNHQGQCPCNPDTLGMAKALCSRALHQLLLYRFEQKQQIWPRMSQQGNSKGTPKPPCLSLPVPDPKGTFLLLCSNFSARNRLFPS